MKKYFLASVLFTFFLCGCTPDEQTSGSEDNTNVSITSNTSVTTSNDGVTSIALTKENIPTYFNVSTTGENGYNHQNFTISFKGVLSFAVYENVIVTLNMHIYCEDNGYIYSARNDDYERKLRLNAAGEGTSILYWSDSTIDHIINVGGDLINYECTWSIKSIEGYVKYRL